MNDCTENKMAHKILIVDDAKTIRQQVNFTLTKGGFEVIEAEDGADGIEKLKANKDVKVIISDINMPNMGGIEMVKAINTSNELPHPPILMLTTEGAAEIVAEAKKAGASGWITKPFKPEVLIEAVKRLVG
jgi:two-component system chemotaxis response regulator CheY